jgi:hypothetical protein
LCDGADFLAGRHVVSLDEGAVVHAHGADEASASIASEPQSRRRLGMRESCNVGLRRRDDSRFAVAKGVLVAAFGAERRFLRRRTGLALRLRCIGETKLSDSCARWWPR